MIGLLNGSVLDRPHRNDVVTHQPGVGRRGEEAPGLGIRQVAYLVFLVVRAEIAWGIHQLGRVAPEEETVLARKAGDANFGCTEFSRLLFVKRRC